MSKIRHMLLIVILAAPLSALAQKDSSIVGTWVLTGAEKLLPVGTSVSDYGSNPHELVIFTADGYYSAQIYCIVFAVQLGFQALDGQRGLRFPVEISIVLFIEENAI